MFKKNMKTNEVFRFLVLFLNIHESFGLGSILFTAPDTEIYRLYKKKKKKKFSIRLNSKKKPRGRNTL